MLHSIPYGFLTSLCTPVYCTLDPANYNTSSSLSNGNLTHTASGASTYACGSTLTFDVATSKLEWTCTIDSGYVNQFGIVPGGTDCTGYDPAGSRYIYYNGNYYLAGSLQGSVGLTFTTSDIIKVRVNNGALSFSKWTGSAWGTEYTCFTGLTGTFMPFQQWGGSGSCTYDFGQTSFVPTAGYSTLYECA